jgi:Immunity protein family (Imm11)
MSEYCLLANSVDRKEIGCFYQTAGLPDGYTVRFYDRPNSMTKLNNDEIPKDNPELIWQMEPKAKLTDVVSAGNISAKGLLCNDRVREILESHKLCEHKFYPATLIHEGKELNYHWFHPIEQDIDIIDFEKSKFALTDYFRDFMNDIEINSKAKLIKEYNERDDDTLITLLDLKLNLHIDFCRFSYIIHNYFIVSDTMKNKLKKSNITGLSFRPIKKSH